MAVFSSLESISNALDTHDIILAPHRLTPARNKQGVIDEELCSSKHGIFNLGFFAVANRPRGVDFAKWWSERLYEFCYDDIPNGIFTDQKWCDHVPAFFSDAFLVLTDKTCDVASWNLYERFISKSTSGQYLVNGDPLKFYHFTGYDSGAGLKMSSRFFKEMPQLEELWRDYGKLFKSTLNNRLHRNLGKLFKTPLQFRFARISSCHTGQIAVTILLKGTFEELP